MSTISVVELSSSPSTTASLRCSRPRVIRSAEGESTHKHTEALISLLLFVYGLELQLGNYEGPSGKLDDTEKKVIFPAKGDNGVDQQEQVGGDGGGAQGHRVHQRVLDDREGKLWRHPEEDAQRRRLEHPRVAPSWSQ